jgi:tetratricopeptide (TPR) repeat protein
LPSSLTPEVAKTTGVFYEMARWFSNRPFLVMFTPPLADVKKELERTPLAARTQAFENWNLWWSEWGVNAVQRGDQVEARATLQWLNEREPKFQFGKWHYARAKIHATLGERSEALRALREAIAQSYPLAGEAQTAEFDALRDDPEFKALIEPNG